MVKWREAGGNERSNSTGPKVIRKDSGGNSCQETKRPEGNCEDDSP